MRGGELGFQRAVLLLPSRCQPDAQMQPQPHEATRAERFSAPAEVMMLRVRTASPQRSKPVLREAWRPRGLRAFDAWAGDEQLGRPRTVPLLLRQLDPADGVEELTRRACFGAAAGPSCSESGA